MRVSGFKERTRVGPARERLREAVTPVEDADRLPLARADGRVLAERVAAARDVPPADRAAIDGYAIRAEDTFGAADGSPAVLHEREDGVTPGAAVRVDTGVELPDGADAIVAREATTAAGGDVEVAAAVAVGENVASAGEDVTEGQSLYEPGHRLRPSDLGLLRSTDLARVPVFRRPEVAVVPTGDELVEADPGAGEVIETDGLTVSTLVERWGGVATSRNVVGDDASALRAAIQRDLTRDLVVTTGGSSVGDRDLVPEVVAELGDVLVHGVALRPGHPFGFGVVRETPVLMLPGSPVACIVNAVQFLRPALKWTGNLPVSPPPSTTARLARKIASEPGVRTFARVSLDRSDETPVATPTGTSSAGVLSSVALADGWVVVPEASEGIPEGETVTVEDWEYAA